MRTVSLFLNKSPSRAIHSRAIQAHFLFVRLRLEMLCRDAMTQAMRVSAFPGDIYFADPNTLTGLPVISILDSFTSLLVLFWREASITQFAQQSISGRDATIILSGGNFMRQRAS